MFQLHVASFVYECTNNTVPVYFGNYFTRFNTIRRIGTRQSMKNKLYAVSCNTTQYGLRSIHYSGVRLWSSLPMEIKDSNTLSNFKRKLKHHYLPVGCYKLKFLIIQLMSFVPSPCSSFSFAYLAYLVYLFRVNIVSFV